MRITIKVVNILILFAAISAFIACNKMNAPENVSIPTSSDYTVTFNSQFINNGSNTTMPSFTSKAVSSSFTIDSLPTDPEMSGYNFGGWWSGQNAGGDPVIVNVTKFKSDVTVYAFWYTYLVTFYMNTDSTTIHTYKGTTPSSPYNIGVLPPDPVRTDYTFTGWNTKSDGSGDDFFATTSVTVDMSVYAQWTSNTDTVYMVSYDSQGGSNVGAQFVDTAVSNTVGTLPTAPENPCYTVFGGWWTKANGAGNQFKETTAVTQDITVYAYWESSVPKVTFNSGWGTTVNAACVTSATNTLVTLPAEPTKPCYEFSGWNTVSDGSGDVFTGSTTVAANITVYAQWTWEGSNTTKTTYAIGDQGPSCIGKVFYIEDGGKKGLEMAPPGWSDWYADDPDPLSVWISGDPEIDDEGNVTQKTQSTLIGTTSTAIWKGEQNTTDIITASGTTASADSAAQLCVDYLGGGYHDWFLPSKDELAQLYAKKDEKKWGGLDENVYGYWSSSEYNDRNAWSHRFSVDSQDGTYKSYERAVRPVRKFDFN